MAWLQLATSVVLAAAIVRGYVTYQASLGQFTHSVAASIKAVSDVVARTAETVESRSVLLDQSGQMLSETGKLIKELRGVAENQVKIAPQYAEGDRVTYAEAEVAARAARVGLWHDVAPVAPWEWRHRK